MVLPAVCGFLFAKLPQNIQDAINLELGNMDILDIAKLTAVLMQHRGALLVGNAACDGCLLHIPMSVGAPLVNE